MAAHNRHGAATPEVVSRPCVNCKNFEQREVKFKVCSLCHVFQYCSKKRQKDDESHKAIEIITDRGSRFILER